MSVIALWGSRTSAYAVSTELCKIEAENLEYVKKWRA